MSNEASQRLLEGLKENQPARQAIQQMRGVGNMPKKLAGVIGVGAGGGNVAHLLTEYDYYTIALNTTEADMKALNVLGKFAITGINGSGQDRNFSATQFKQYYKSFFEDEKTQELVAHDLIYVVGTGGGGTGTIVSVMVTNFLKREFPNKTIIAVGLLGSLKEPRQSQENMRDFLSDLETKTAGAPYMLFDNNRVRGKVGDDVYEAVNHDAVNAIRLLTKEYFVENTRSNIDGRDYARLTSFSGLLSVVTIDRLNITVAEETVDLVPRVKAAIDNSTAVFTKDPSAYGIFMSTHNDVYRQIDTTFNDIQDTIGRPSEGLVFKHLQQRSDSIKQGPEFGIIVTGTAAPVERFKQIETRIAEESSQKEKDRLPEIKRNNEKLTFAGDGSSNQRGSGDTFLEEF
jgi:hypothetical protein